MVESAPLTNHSLRARDVHLYYLCELLSGGLIYFMAVFSPWAFGCTEPWSIWTMNGCGYSLGLLLLLKLSIRFSANCVWDAPKSTAGNTPLAVNLTPGLLLCTLGLLGYCLLSAVNARATYLPASMSFEHHRYVRWLPSSLDSPGTWAALWNYLGLACSFWGVRDWLLERPASNTPSPFKVRNSETSFTPRLRRLFWILTLSGGALGLEGIVQRLCDSPKLLFLVKPEIHQNALEQFASFAYRGNAAQYFNLLWPVCIGFWWLLARSPQDERIFKWPVLVCAALMAACPIISSARGAALVDFALLLATTLVLAFLMVRRRQTFRPVKARLIPPFALFLAGVLILGFGLGWKQLGPRLDLARAGLAERQQLYAPALRMVSDYPLFGIGPGTFGRVFQLYRPNQEAYWPAQLHNDWLETRVTWGAIGESLLLLSLVLVLLRAAIQARRTGPGMILWLCLSLLGCFIEARWDFPLQVYSILFLFIVWCSVLFTLDCAVQHPP